MNLKNPYKCSLAIFEVSSFQIVIRFWFNQQTDWWRRARTFEVKPEPFSIYSSQAFVVNISQQTLPCADFLRKVPDGTAEVVLQKGSDLSSKTSAILEVSRIELESNQSGWLKNRIKPPGGIGQVGVRAGSCRHLCRYIDCFSVVSHAPLSNEINLDLCQYIAHSWLSRYLYECNGNVTTNMGHK